MPTNEETTKTTPLPVLCDLGEVTDLNNLKDQLRKCKAKIESDQMNVNNWKNRVSKLEADIASFDKASGQIDQIYEEYKKAYENIEKDKDFIKNEYDKWNRSLPTSQEDRSRVDGVIEEIKTEIDKSRIEIGKLEKCEGEITAKESILYAEVEFKKTLQIFSNLETNFENLKNGLKKINENIKKGKDSSKSIQDELNKRTENGEQNKKYEMNAYFYSKELEDIKGLLEKWIKAPDSFKLELKTALIDLGKKKIELNGKEGRLNEWKAKLEDTKKKLEAAEKSRNKNILDRL